MKINILEEFLKLEHPLPKETVELICRSFFKYLKYKIDDNNFHNIRVKHFGVFTIYPGRAKLLIRNKQKEFEKGNITREELQEFIEKANFYIKNNSTNNDYNE